MGVCHHGTVAIFKRWSHRAGHDLAPDARALLDHLRRLFPDRTVDVEAAPQRRIYARVPTFHLLVIRPNRPGDGWLPGSDCDQLLVSLPYPCGSQFETCAWPDGHIRLLWL